MKNVTISAREGFSDIPVITALNYDKILLENVTFDGFTSPKIVAKSIGEIQCVNSGEIKVIK